MIKKRIGECLKKGGIKSLVPPGNGWTLVRPFTKQIFEPIAVDTEKTCGKRLWIEEYYYKKTEKEPNVEICVIGYFVHNGTPHKIWATLYIISMARARQHWDILFLANGDFDVMSSQSSNFYFYIENNQAIFGLREDRKEKRIFPIECEK